VSSPDERLRRDYTPPLLAYLAHPEERGLLTAYELGRRAMDPELGLLTLVRVHHEVLHEVLLTVRDADEATSVVAKASAFLSEALASFEMGQRGFMAGEGRTAPPRGVPNGGDDPAPTSR
jgi:hypothetical protein